MVLAMKADRSRRVGVICMATRGRGAGSGATESCSSVSLVNGVRDIVSGVVSPFSMVMMAGGQIGYARLLLVGLNRQSWCSWLNPLASRTHGFGHQVRWPQ
uniref:Uncharacterized protein n=1 Tax=Oryza punctata TaxID=4537 RepID=A0A0E0KCX0_ORYPU